MSKTRVIDFCVIICGGPTGSPTGGLGSQLSGLRSQVSGLRSQVSGLRSQVWVLGCLWGVLGSLWVSSEVSIGSTGGPWVMGPAIWKLQNSCKLASPAQQTLLDMIYPILVFLLLSDWEEASTRPDPQGVGGLCDNLIRIEITAGHLSRTQVKWLRCN